MNKYIALVCILVWSSACAGSDAPAILATQEVHTSVASNISNIVGDILSHPNQYSGQQVEIVGYFRGWDLLHETQQAPPVSRSDWVIADLSGAIYVTGSAPPGLDPASLSDTRSMVRLSATVKYIEQSTTVYLSADHAERLDTRQSDSQLARLPDEKCSTTVLTNPAAVYCIQIMGYEYKIVETSAGQQDACVLPDGKTCEAWDFMKGKCGQEFSFCERQGYDMLTIAEGTDPYSQEYAVCIARDGQRVGTVSELSGLKRKLSVCGRK